MTIKKIIKESLREIGWGFGRRTVIVFTLEDLAEITSDQILDYPLSGFVECFYIKKNSEYHWAGKYYYQSYNKKVIKK